MRGISLAFYERTGRKSPVSVAGPISSGTFRIVFNGHATGNPPMDPIVTLHAPGDWEAVRRIYKEAIATGHASFDTDVPGLGRLGQEPSEGMPACRSCGR